MSIGRRLAAGESERYHAMDMYHTLRGVLLGLALAALCSPEAGAQAPAVNDAPLQPGDRVLVKIWLDTTFSDTVRIDRTGTLALPRVGPVSVAGLPASQVPDSVRRAFAQVTRTLAIEVTPLRRVTVGGDVNDPGVYYLETHATFREAVTAAEGIAQIGSTDKLQLMRGASRTLVADWQERGAEDVLVHSGDVLWVGRESWLKRNLFSVISGTSVLLSLILTLSQ